MGVLRWSAEYEAHVRFAGLKYSDHSEIFLT